MNCFRRRFLSGIAVAGTAALAGCRDDDESDTETGIPPTILFSFAYEPAAETEPEDVGTLTITHEGDEPVEASELLIRGDGIIQMGAHDYSAGGTDTVDTVLQLRFNGDTTDWSDSNKSAGPLRHVTESMETGESVTFGVEADYKIYIIWDPPETANSSVLGSDEGTEG